MRQQAAMAWHVGGPWGLSEGTAKALVGGFAPLTSAFVWSG